MAARGRGTLEVGRSPNPFYQTSSSMVGVAGQDPVQWDAPKVPCNPCNETATKPSFSFLYTRESDSIGVGVPTNDSPMIATLKQLPTKAQLARQRGPGLHPSDGISVPLPLTLPEEPASPQVDVRRVLDAYVHERKVEDPRYTTSANEVGKNPPSIATFVSKRCGIPQDFSKSFNGVKPRNTALNTSMNRSTVHSKLDQHFL